MSMEALIPSPIQRIRTACTDEKGINLYIKRDDLIHNLVSGNKYRKLRYNLKKIKSEGKNQVITFGGAFSNHLHAMAAACHYNGLNAVGIIRGEIDSNNPTLRYCSSVGMELISVTREAYRQKEASPQITAIVSSYPDAVIIPEGGTNKLALCGVAEILDEINMEADIPNLDYIVLAGGTGGTTAGLLTYSELKSQVICFSVLKSNHLKHDILELAAGKNADRLIVNTDYHFGGYAKWNDELLTFIDGFEKEVGIPLDHVYNGKAMYGLVDLIAKDRFPQDTNVLYLHTGGLQGKQGLEYMLGK